MKPSMNGHAANISAATKAPADHIRFGPIRSVSLPAG